MPMLYVYPSAAPLTLVIGFFCALETYYTNSVWPAVFTHLLCRLALYGGDLLYASEALGPDVRLWWLRRQSCCFLLFLFSLLRGTEGLLRDGLLERFQRGPERTSENIWNSLKTLGFLLFLILYITRLCYDTPGHVGADAACSYPERILLWQIMIMKKNVLHKMARMVFLRMNTSFLIRRLIRSSLPAIRNPNMKSMSAICAAAGNARRNVCAGSVKRSGRIMERTTTWRSP